MAAKIFVGLEPGTEKANNLNRLFAIVNAYFSVGDKMHLGLVFPGLRKLPFTIAGKAHAARQKLRELFVEEIKVRRGSKQEICLVSIVMQLMKKEIICQITK